MRIKDEFRLSDDSVGALFLDSREAAQGLVGNVFPEALLANLGSFQLHLPQDPAILIDYLKTDRIPDIDEKSLPPGLKMKAGAFVTLKKSGDLRGCIGHFEADYPLYTIVQKMAVASSTQDYRFSQVTPAELEQIDIEISVLTPMQKINDVKSIRLGIDGIYIKKGSRAGTFLPQVATDTGWTLDEFLGHCARDKAGIGWDGWKDKDVEIFIYQAFVFGEKE